jgi:hypothetical protein
MVGDSVVFLSFVRVTVGDLIIGDSIVFVSLVGDVVGTLVEGEGACHLIADDDGKLELGIAVLELDDSAFSQGSTWFI